MPRPTEAANHSRESSRDPSRSVAILGAFSFFLSALEYTFPKPLPFMRLGIANLPLLLAVDILPLPSYFLLALVKFAGMSLVSGTLFSYIAVFSLAGSLASALAMRGVRFIFRSGVSHLGISVAGAMASAASQVLLARWLVFGAAAWAIAPLFLGASLVTGSLLGVFANRFAANSLWYSGRNPEGSACQTSVSLGDNTGSEAGSREVRHTSFNWYDSIPPGRLALAGLLVALALLFQPVLAYKALLVAGLALLLGLSGGKIKLFQTLMIIISIIAANLAIPVGRVLTRIGPFAVTETALLEGFGKALTFEGLIFVSRLALRPGLALPGSVGRAVSDAFAAWRRMTEFGPRFRPASFVEDADALLLRLEVEEHARTVEKDQPPGARTSASGEQLLRVPLGRSDLAMAAGVAAAIALLVAGRLAAR